MNRPNKQQNALTEEKLKLRRAQVELYVTSNELAWSPSTIRSERYRLLAVAHLLDRSPSALWSHCERISMAPYSRVTLWTRVVQFFDWLISEGHESGTNEYRAWRKKHARLFKNSYQQRIPEISYEEGRARLEQLPDADSRNKAMQLLENCLRVSESATLSNGEVVGKGGKRRRVFGAQNAVPYARSYATFRRHLRQVGLKPHDLRKLGASKLADLGAGPLELCAFMGWSDPKTAMSYIRLRDSKLEQLSKKLRS